jgi:adenosylcobinamide kinase / adenosylcobinamide-phosphate guanylyltransferase
MGKMALIMGGVRSGKSRFAEQLAAQLGGERVLYVATAEARDAEMQRRIGLHRQSRPAAWRTLEATHDIGRRLLDDECHDCVVLLDCLTLLVSNLLLSCSEPLEMDLAEQRITEEIEALAAAAAQRPGPVIVVSGEVGMGIVPETPLGRAFRDLLGRANQRLGQHAAAVYLLIAGQPIELKSLADSLPAAAARLSAESVPCR